MHKKNTYIHQLSQSNTNTQTYTHSTGQNPEYIPLPYVQGLSEKLSGILKPFNIKIAPRNENDFSHFFKSSTDQINKLDTADVVYNISCTGCTASYIGTTKRPLKTRITEHKS